MRLEVDYDFAKRLRHAQVNNEVPLVNDIAQELFPEETTPGLYMSLSTMVTRITSHIHI